MPADVFEIVELGAYAFWGWRYLFSGSFRRATHKRWRREGWTAIVFDVFMALLGMAFTGLLIGVVVWMGMDIWRG